MQGVALCCVSRPRRRVAPGGSETTGTVSIVDSPGSLFVAYLRPASSASASAASGLATIVLSASGTLATVNVSFSNLSSNQVGGHLFLGNSTATGDYVMNFPIGQVNGAQWDIRPTATKVGKYPFYCGKKLPFMAGHREKGMEGILEVVP